MSAGPPGKRCPSPGTTTREKSAICMPQQTPGAYTIPHQRLARQGG